MSFRSALPLPCVLLLVACVAGPASVRAQDRIPVPTPPPTTGMGPRSIHVTGTGEARATPDEAYVDLAVETQARTAKEAAAENARKMDSVVAALVQAGVPRKDIETRNYNLFPEYAPEPPRPVESRPQGPRVTGYRAVNSVQVRTRALDQLGGYIDRALAAGANRVDSVRFALSNPQEAQGRALTEAVKRARASAEVIAQSLGVKLGPVLEASTTTEAPPVYPMRMAARAEGAADMVPTPISPGEQTVTGTVSLRYAIDGGR
jgi:uncharacterized protein